LVKNQKLPGTILTPTTKAEQGERDEPITADEIVDKGLLTSDQWKAAAKISLNLFARGREKAAAQGLILVDTKYEFGFDGDGTIVVADELHTPDSSRYWTTASYETRLAGGEEPEGLDKEFLRLWVRARCDPYKDPVPEIPADTIEEFSGKYIALYETVTGRAFERVEGDEPIRERVRRNLADALPDYFS
jgi:phosphoribosylaminoimidazole-succinocarboxamide synthase